MTLNRDDQSQREDKVPAARVERVEQEEFAGEVLKALITTLVDKGYIRAENQERVLDQLDDKVTAYFRMLRRKIGKEVQKGFDEDQVFQSSARTFFRTIQAGTPIEIEDVYSYFARILLFKLYSYTGKELGRKKKSTAATTDEAADATPKTRARQVAMSDLVQNDEQAGADLEGAFSTLARLFEMSEGELHVESDWVEEKVDQLPRLHREVLRMKLQGLSEQEIAESLAEAHAAEAKRSRKSGKSTQSDKSTKTDRERPNWVKHCFREARRGIALSLHHCPECGTVLSRTRRLPGKCPNEQCAARFDKKDLELANLLR